MLITNPRFSTSHFIWIGFDVSGNNSFPEYEKNKIRASRDIDDMMTKIRRSGGPIDDGRVDPCVLHRNLRRKNKIHIRI